jgi:hypothetical protein
MIRRIATVSPTTIPVLSLAERAEIVGDASPSNAKVLAVSVTRLGVGLVVIISLVDGGHNASDWHGVCDDVESEALLAGVMILES